MQKLPKFNPGITFYRGIGIPIDEIPEFLVKYSNGFSVNDNTILSIAKRVEDSFIGREGKNIEFEIRGNVNDLSQARDIHDFAWAKYWNSKNPKYPSTLSEGVFLPNANIKVVERLPNNNNIYRFILTEY